MGAIQQRFPFADEITDVGTGLRNYQVEALRAVKSARQRGIRRSLVVLPTGTGKSVVFRNLPHVMGWKRTLALVHRIELVDQAATHLATANKGKSVQVERADLYADRDADIVVACVPSLRQPRLERWAPDHFDGIITDEVHHGMAKSWTNILRHFGVAEPHGPTMVGFTATPFRGDGKPLANLFDEIVYSKGIREMIEQGWLANLRAMRIETQTDLSNLHTRYGDFSEDELARLTNTDGRNCIIVSAIEAYCKDRNGIMVFGVGVEHVESITDQLQQRGHSAACILGHTPELERKRILRDFNQGALRILVSCGVLSEGVDIPRADCAVLGRPWKSQLGYIQQVGRVLRPHPAKLDALIIDVVDVVGKHVIQTATRLFGKRDVDVLGQDVLGAVDAIEEAEEQGILLEDGDTVEDVKQKGEKIARIARGIYIVPTVAEAVDIFHSCVIADDVINHSQFPWIGVGKDTWKLKLKGTESIMLHGDTLGNWQVNHMGNVRPLGAHEGVPWTLADRAVKDAAPDFWKVKRMEARWRNHPASPKQVDVLRRMGFRAIPPRLTKGAASDMMDTLSARRQRK